MKLVLRGKARKSACEQAMLNFFPEQPEGNATFSLTEGIHRRTASVCFDLGTAKAAARAHEPLNSGNPDRLLKECAFRAASKLLPTPPPWGSLTGIRPAKLAQSVSALQLTEQFHVQPYRAHLAEACAQIALKEKANLGRCDVAIYIAIPFCPTRCAYCSFVSSGLDRSSALVEPFLETLHWEIEKVSEFLKSQNQRVCSLYIGGGTPTSLSAQQLSNLLEHVSTHLDLKHCREITVEAGRPDTITKEKLQVLQNFQVNRISINPQSTSDTVLQEIGRCHDKKTFFQSFEDARKLNFRNINTDIIAGLPSDTPELFEQTIEDVLSLHPENITVHTFSRKKGALLASAKAQPVGELLEYSSVALTAHGYHPYYVYRQKFMNGGFENVGWSLEGKECIYNLHMMEELVSVIALGAGGITKLVSRNRIDRFPNCKYPLEYNQSRDRIETRLSAMSLWLSSQLTGGFDNGFD
jgi:oxygen-independent coproporphyrinogen-3 oxidase